MLQNTRCCVTNQITDNICYDVNQQGYFENHPVGAEKRPEVPNLFCGKRKAINQLIVNGVQSKPGAWPWHVAIYRLERATLRYICGGTLVSNLFILTGK